MSESSSGSFGGSKKIAETLVNLERWVERVQAEVCDLAGKQEELKRLLLTAGDSLTVEWSQKVQSQLRCIHKAAEEVNRLLKNP